jgi:hypothetical protein
VLWYDDISLYTEQKTQEKLLEKITYEKTLHLEQARTSTKQQNIAKAIS